MQQPRSLISSANHIHLTGIKGVAMTSLAQCLVDMGKTVSGSDVAEDFVTAEVLQKLNLNISVGFDTANIPNETDLVIFTAAHQGSQNPQVQWATQNNISVMSHAEALGDLTSQKQVIAVCGVGGKSTTSAMITWGFHALNQPVSFSVGVGDIPGIGKTGQYHAESKWFITEADEYAVDPSDQSNFLPRFTYLKPQVVICTSLFFDHPDVYKDLEHTKQTFKEFFLSINPNGTLIINGSDDNLLTVANQIKTERNDIKLIKYGNVRHSRESGNLVTDIHLNELDFSLENFSQTGATSTSQIGTPSGQYDLVLHVPGKHNALNAVAAIAAWAQTDIDVKAATESLSKFRSTLRRFEFKGQHEGVTFYDDYAHHPRELQVIIDSLKSMYPENRVVVIFQPHTYSRTKALLDEFAQTLSQVSELVLVAIFASAREAKDDTISSQILADKIKQINPQIKIQLEPNVESAAKFISSDLHPGDVCITLGAGDVYKIHELIP